MGPPDGPVVPIRPVGPVGPIENKLSSLIEGKGGDVLGIVSTHVAPIQTYVVPASL